LVKVLPFKGLRLILPLFAPVEGTDVEDKLAGLGGDFELGLVFGLDAAVVGDDAGREDFRGGVPARAGGFILLLVVAVDVSVHGALVGSVDEEDGGVGGEGQGGGAVFVLLNPVDVNGGLVVDADLEARGGDAMAGLRV
jgi:hypothetical protein